jgi:hypothetical protein
MAQPDTRNIDAANQTRELPANGHLDVVTLGELTFG